MKFTGYCPQCKLKGVETKMLPKQSIGIYECPIDHLLIVADDKLASMFIKRGDGNYDSSQNAYQHPYSVPYIGKNNKIIETKEDVAYFLQTEVTPYVELSLHNLIHYYSLYKFTESDYKKMFKTEYHRQSAFFNIDLGHPSILRKLKLRDAKAGNTLGKSFKHTYDLMILLFQKYYNNDISWLPQEGMGAYQVALCKKHLPNSDIKLLEKNEALRKQRIMTFLIDLVEIIYFNKRTKVNKKYIL